MVVVLQKQNLIVHGSTTKTPESASRVFWGIGFMLAGAFSVSFGTFKTTGFSGRIMLEYVLLYNEGFPKKAAP